VGLKRALDGLCRRASLAIKAGYSLLILSDRGVDEEYAPIPEPLLALDGGSQSPGKGRHAHRVGPDHRVGRATRSDALRLLIGYGASASILIWRSKRLRIWPRMAI
jgi:glutamate synthase (NADPH/NADH) large chain